MNAEEDLGANLLIIMALLEHSQDEGVRIWKSFENEISKKSRFFPNTEKICAAIDFCLSETSYSMPKGERIYRARIIHENELSAKTRATLDKLPGRKHEDIFGTERSTSYSKMLRRMNRDASRMVAGNSADLYEELRNNSYWGFSAQKSGAPPSEKASAGRINSAGISFLYAAESVHTAIVESRPVIGQTVSVAEIEIKRLLRLFDFTVDLVDQVGSKAHMYTIFNEISRQFTMPNHYGDAAYLPTQYISELLRSKGFDGIRYHSSLHEGGINIVLFDTEKDEKKRRNYTIGHSAIHFVKGIEIAVEQLLPLREHATG